ncbi:MAG: cell wall hydrolase [Lachnospiraceae bacterium]
MTGAEPRGNVIYLQEVRGNAQRSSARRPPRRTSPRPLHRKAVRRLTVSAAIAVLTVAALLAFLMPWSGTEQTPLSAAGQADTPPASLTALAPIEEDKPAYIPDAAEVEALAKMLYGEARGVASDTEKAACVWCVLNRVDDPRFPDTVLEVVAAPYQFAGYSADYPVLPELEWIAADVLTRYHEEKSGGDNVGRVLPADYCFFTGDGEHNYFTIGWKDTETWGWTLSSPYDD